METSIRHVQDVLKHIPKKAGYTMELTGHAPPWMPQLPCGAGLAPRRYTYPVDHKIWDRVLVCLLIACRDDSDDEHTKTLLKGLARHLYKVCAIKKRRVHLKTVRDPHSIEAVRAGVSLRLDRIRVVGRELNDEDRRHLRTVCRLDA
jgi:hypothetical protein